MPLALVCASCLNPQNDFNAYEGRAADASVPGIPTGTTDAAMVDAASLRAPDAGFEDTSYVMICLSQLGPSLAEALLWKVTLTYTAEGSGGNLDFQSIALPAGSTNINSPITGSASSIANTPIDSHGAGTVTIGSYVLPQAANGITGQAVQLESLEAVFHIESPSQVCCGLGADITAPTAATLTPDQNPCLFLPTNSKGQWTPPTLEQFHCP